MSAEMELQGMKVEKLYESITAGGVAPADASIMVAEWILQNYGKTKRTFAYQQAFPQDVPGCKPSFARSFVHRDWIDGESVVQAEHTTVEEGFNDRFHKIEADLESLGRDVAKAFEGLAEMRRGLRTLLDEIKAELNRINTDIYECCIASKEAAPGPYYPGAINKGAYMGTATVGSKKYDLWQTETGMLMLPEIEKIDMDPLTDPLRMKASQLGRFMIRRPDVVEALGGQITKEVLVERFGDEVVSGTQRVRDIVRGLPANQKYKDVNEIVQAVARTDAVTMRSNFGEDAVLSTVFGPEGQVADVAGAPVEKVRFMPSEARAALVAAGVTTVGKLAAEKPASLAEKLTRGGVKVSAEQAAEWVGVAMTAASMRRA